MLEIETLVDIADPTGYTAAHYAAMSGNDACLAVLLNNDADPNQRDVNLMSPVDYGKYSGAAA